MDEGRTLLAGYEAAASRANKQRMYVVTASLYRSRPWSFPFQFFKWLNGKSFVSSHNHLKSLNIIIFRCKTLQMTCDAVSYRTLFLSNGLMR